MQNITFVIIWIIWDAIFDCLESRPDSLQKQIIQAIQNLFCVKYTTACVKKRRKLEETAHK